MTNKQRQQRTSGAVVAGPSEDALKAEIIRHLLDLVAHGTTNSKEQRLKCSATSRCGRTTARARAFHAAIDKPQELGWIVWGAISQNGPHGQLFGSPTASEYRGAAVDVSITALLFPLIVGGLLLFDALN